MKRIVVAFLIMLISVSLVVIAIHWKNNAKYYPIRVLSLPNGFVNLQEATEKTNGAMKYVFFEEYISLVDENGDSVGGALVRDKSFIIMYQNNYYVNAEQFYSALEKASQ